MVYSQFKSSNYIPSLTFWPLFEELEQKFIKREREAKYKLPAESTLFQLDDAAAVGREKFFTFLAQFLLPLKKEVRFRRSSSLPKKEGWGREVGVFRHRSINPRSLPTGISWWKRGGQEGAETRMRAFTVLLLLVAWVSVAAGLGICRAKESDANHQWCVDNSWQVVPVGKGKCLLGASISNGYEASVLYSGINEQNRIVPISTTACCQTNDATTFLCIASELKLPVAAPGYVYEFVNLSWRKKLKKISKRII